MQIMTFLSPGDHKPAPPDGGGGDAQARRHAHRRRHGQAPSTDCHYLRHPAGVPVWELRSPPTPYTRWPRTARCCSRLTPTTIPSWSPMLCKSSSISPDGLTYTFKIRPNVLSHDGSPLTPHDVKATLDLADVWLEQ